MPAWVLLLWWVTSLGRRIAMNLKSVAGIPNIVQDWFQLHFDNSGNDVGAKFD